MKILCSIALVLTSIFSWGQNNAVSSVLINGSPSHPDAFLFFPLTNDSLNLNNPNFYSILRQSMNKKLFYCCCNNEKSRLFIMDSIAAGTESGSDFKIPDPLFYKALYQNRICPLCHKTDCVVPFVYGKPSSRAIELDKRGQIKLAGCMLSNTSPKFYCKADKLEF
jgi:hypothetical protein